MNLSPKVPGSNNLLNQNGFVNDFGGGGGLISNAASMNAVQFMAVGSRLNMATYAKKES